MGWLGIQIIMANGGSCFLPIRMARSFIQQKRLFRVADAPEFPHPAFKVFPREADSDAIELGLAQLRALAIEEQQTVLSSHDDAMEKSL